MPHMKITARVCSIRYNRSHWRTRAYISTFCSVYVIFVKKSLNYWQITAYYTYLTSSWTFSDAKFEKMSQFGCRNMCVNPLKTRNECFIHEIRKSTNMPILNHLTAKVLTRLKISGTLEAQIKKSSCIPRFKTYCDPLV